MVVFKNVDKKYSDGTVALDDVSFEISPGEFVFVIGTSGAGKTTLMKHIVKEEVPTKGEIIIDEDKLSEIKRPDLPLLRRKVGFIYQDFKLLDSENVFENVSLSLRVIGKPEKEIDTIVPNLLHLVGLGDKSERFPYNLSGGEKQRLVIARALAHEPKILLADEPTGNLDNASTWVVVDLIKKINEWGTTIIFGTHDNKIVDTLKKRVIHLEKGRIISDAEGGKYE
ncbi:cell division ATP-binding protein FtsE [candidate division WWE3 bacterium RIFCSPLOWO2_01_FULL_39_13]|uniref:Cell division ATP-binding protein FtsE n=1 Tax=candidate division WWE3 bacterium RIFCSPLOWO2_01_FULL_39_13 TaxID=1802624 RepID=A0A1F4V3U0_UNCKA|nr:MAG: cell division ATP-binding protein FtsE [candidate division WWE3 bacterium RIFCSPLOWO2_01_FULL_39_13]